MSCLSPLTIINPTKRISLQGGAPFQIQVPCGTCAACRRSKHDEYYFRAFYEGKLTFDVGGFIQAVTLTYNDHCLPHLSDFIDDVSRGSSLDFPCFSRKDIRKFLVRLRSALTDAGYDIKGKLNYFIAAEYGTASTKTHRPHYHVLFYVRFFIDAFEFSRIVGRCWSFGLTDTVLFKPRSYVRYYTFGIKYTSDLCGLQKKAMYVSKYVQKSSSFSRSISKRISAVIGSRYNLSGSKLSWFINNEGKDIYRSLLNLVNQFHRQGNGFGSSFLIYNDINDVLSTGMIRIQDTQNVVRHICLPMYYKRILFYNCVKDFRGVRTWQLNDLGVNWKFNRTLDSVHRLSLRFSDWFDNLYQYLPATLPSSQKSELFFSLRSRVNYLLDGRSFDDFACYVGIYKGRIKSDDQRCREFLGTFKRENLDIWLCGILGIVDPENEKFSFSYTTPSDYSLFGSRFLCSEYLGDSQNGLVDNIYSLRDKSNSMRLQEFIKYYVINDSSDPLFKGFDELYSLYVETSSWHSDSLTAAEELRMSLEANKPKSNHI